MGIKENASLGGRFTWSNFKSSPTCKPNRFLFLPKWENLFSNLLLDKGYARGLFHIVVLFFLSTETKQHGSIPFKFENVNNKMKHWWRGTTGMVWQ